MTDPISRLRAWIRAAAKAGAPMPDAMVLATVDSRGRPSARYVLLKEVSARGLVFYTNANSRKGIDMAGNDRVALVFYWDVTGRQVRIEGKVSTLSAGEADEYWQERPVASRYASAASNQSHPIASRSELLRRYAALENEFPDGSIPRPAHWKGYLVAPDAIEFWTRAEPRLHKRELFTKKRSAGAPQWKSEILQP
ncbi:MAG TPA: pyridoxamine 5'-phosphate oxidase [Candidatus Limnocylindrales bacterium]|nr:pyridoxamine 5'-phosphate oxidase [Candidatus Limnocylindrales bacterium]